MGIRCLSLGLSLALAGLLLAGCGEGGAEDEERARVAATVAAEEAWLDHAVPLLEESTEHRLVLGKAFGEFDRAIMAGACDVEEFACVEAMPEWGEMWLEARAWRRALESDDWERAVDGAPLAIGREMRTYYLAAHALASDLLLAMEELDGDLIEELIEDFREAHEELFAEMERVFAPRQ